MADCVPARQCVRSYLIENRLHARSISSPLPQAPRSDCRPARLLPLMKASRHLSRLRCNVVGGRCVRAGRLRKVLAPRWAVCRVQDYSRWMELAKMQIHRCGPPGVMAMLQDASASDVIAAVSAVSAGEAVCPPRAFAPYYSVACSNVCRNAPRRLASLNLILLCANKQLVTLRRKGLHKQRNRFSLDLSEFTVRSHPQHPVNKWTPAAEARLWKHPRLR